MSDARKFFALNDVNCKRTWILGAELDMSRLQSPYHTVIYIYSTTVILHNMILAVSYGLAFVSYV